MRVYILYLEIINMEKVLISLPDQLALRMRATIPPRQRSKIITNLIEKEIERRERLLYECALAVENDTNLKQEMSEWDITINDGLHEKIRLLPKITKTKKNIK